jgi:hypothetical protein
VTVTVRNTCRTDLGITNGRTTTNWIKSRTGVTIDIAMTDDISNKNVMTDIVTDQDETIDVTVLRGGKETETRRKTTDMTEDMSAVRKGNDLVTLFYFYLIRMLLVQKTMLRQKVFFGSFTFSGIIPDKDVIGKNLVLESPVQLFFAGLHVLF